MPDASEAKCSIEEAGLVYVHDSVSGIRRVSTAKGFTYRSASGTLIRSARTLERIRQLAIPPAYTKVWISPIANGHLQATGFDARGRKQYRYHVRFREMEERAKFDRLSTFGKALPSLRAVVKSDLERRGLPKRKVLAVVVYLLERSLIRVGNKEYARANGSYGLTTMPSRLVHVEGSEILFGFLGKSGIRHQIDIHDRRLARIVKRLQELPGQELFQYVGEHEKVGTISSADVNAYLHEEMGAPFTAKDFRTWWGTLLALTELSLRDAPTSDAEAKREIKSVMNFVSERLGNTAAICRKCYVHPCVLECFRRGRLPRCQHQDPKEVLDWAERALLRMLAGDCANR